jgi:GWxTD domain-containing protein
MEVYCSFYQKGLKFESSDGTFQAAGLLEIVVTNNLTKEVLFSSFNKIPVSLSDTAGSNLTKRLIVQKNIPLNPGEYKLKVIGKDFYDTLKADSALFDINIAEVSNSPQISGLELSSSVFKSTDTSSNFYKYGIEAVPNPSLLFGKNLSDIFYYYELYRFGKNNASDAFKIITKIERADQNNSRYILKSKEKHVQKFSDIMLDFGSFTIDSILTGTYYLVTNIIDTINSYSITQEKKFFVYNGSAIDTSKVSESGFLVSEFVTMKENQIQDEFDKAVYVRKDEDNSNFNKLKTIDEKRKFLYNFWKKRDPTPETPYNEFKRDYMAKINEANLLFKQPFLDGWKTDRGRIYVIYGKPSDIERFPYEGETKSYEIWHYDEIQSGAICVFIESQQYGSGNYTLSHSTLRNELRNDNWQALLTK